MLVLRHLFALLTQLGAADPVPGSYPAGLAAQIEEAAVRDECGAAEAAEIAKIRRDFPECVDEYGTDGLSGLDADELRDACQEW